MVGSMGFRNFRDFNMAMLEKQVWRLVVNPESFVARLYKVRYYANGILFEANVGHNPSFVWRSVWEAINLVKDGCRWSIGACQMSILNQPWLQDEASPYISSVNQV